MSTDMTVGIVVLSAALVLLTALTAWGMRTIERIARKGQHSAREIRKVLRDES